MTGGLNVNGPIQPDPEWMKSAATQRALILL